MQLTTVYTLPKQFNDYTLLEENKYVAYKRYNFLHSYIHYSDNLFDTKHLIEHITEKLNATVNGTHTQMVKLYSPLQPCIEMKQLQKQYSHFQYNCIPLLLFCQASLQIKHSNANINTNWNKNFCCLNNRSTQDRLDLFNFLKQNNLTDRGYVSYRNTKRIIEENEFLLDECYVNFDDPYYKSTDKDNPREYIRYYPVNDFLFDFTCETFINDEIFLTEKSTKAFIWGKIPVVFGMQNTMNYIEQFGFDIFRDIVDYQYDLCNDYNMRFEFYTQEVKRLANLNLNSLTDLSVRFKNNQLHFFKLVERCNLIMDSIVDHCDYISDNREKLLGF